MRFRPQDPAIREPHPDEEPGDMVADDLWSLPGSAVPVQADQLDGARLGLLQLTGGLQPDSGLQSDSGLQWAGGLQPDSGLQSDGGTQSDSGTHPAKGRGPWSVELALLVAIAVLVGLGYLARQLEPSVSSGGGSYDNQPAGSNAQPAGSRPDQPLSPSPFPAPGGAFPTPDGAFPTPDGARPAVPVVEGAVDCPMRLEPAGGAESDGSPTPAAGERPCFFIE